MSVLRQCDKCKVTMSAEMWNYEEARIGCHHYDLCELCAKKVMLYIGRVDE